MENPHYDGKQAISHLGYDKYLRNVGLVLSISCLTIIQQGRHIRVITLRKRGHSLECGSRNVLELAGCVHPSGGNTTTISIQLSLEAMDLLGDLVHLPKDG